ncbi:FMN-binding glutamate synthase family protein [Halioxenophilus sp. WMMB6]|uniref:FMN-binding glutamate synthase family protein n=1 Tax=Halioxenophilus sp. WMMB6 TaxID=3073815 RepID=UPI00295F22BD|nr:FMN-binding glutamate synthase family protein [Halioxenophilus sp. WMMB6]
MQNLSLSTFTVNVLAISAILFVVALGLTALAVVYMYWVDTHQKKHTVRRNYPVIGRFRYFFEYLGEFFRQYFFAQDREELPFNRAQRSWVYRAAKNIDSTIAFGSTRPLNQPGDVLFLNCLFPTIAQDHVPPAPVVIGEGYARFPYAAQSFFNISGMSFGALSQPAVRALSRGAAKAGIWMNTGEGGLSPYHLEGGCDLIFQLGTAKYGVQDNEGRLDEQKLLAVSAHEQVKMFEIKLSQGAKPGKGGMLPGAKVTAEIARIRSIPEGQDSISPNGHVDIRSLDQLLDMVHRIRELTGKPTGMKLVLGSADWLDEICLKIHERGWQYAPDFITLDSADGGTGAAPQSLMDFMGLPIAASLPVIADKLVEYGLKQRIRLIVSGKLINPGKVAWALAMGADFVVSARGFLFSLGCIQALQCNKNTCPTGITTHDKDLQRGLDPQEKSERVYHYATTMVKEVGVLAHSCGVTDPRSLNRHHLQIINETGLPEPMTDLYPVVRTRPEYDLP